MTTDVPHTDPRHLAEVLGELATLRSHVDDLQRRVVALESGKSRADPAPSPAGDPVQTEAPGDDSLWSWLGQSRVLPRVAMVSFVLVVALVLRTLTDSRTIGLELGVVLGIAYSGVLAMWGWRALARQRQGQRVLPACAAVLMCAVVLEAHGPFELLSSASACWILMAALVALTALGMRYRAGSVVAIAVLSTSVSALTLGFPNPPFANVAAVLLVANLAAILTTTVRSSAWLPWPTFGVTLFFWLLWAIKANAGFRHTDGMPAIVQVEWFLPYVVAFVLLYAIAATWRAVAAPRSPGAFFLVAPTANAVWAYPAALAVIVPDTGRATTLGAVGVAVAVMHFGIAAYLWRRIRECSAVITSFAVAATLLLAVATVSLTGEMLYALPVWSATAWALARRSTTCGSLGLRLLSYGLQSLTCVFAVAGAVFVVPSTTPVTALLAAAAITALATLHFRHCRAHGPAPGTWFAKVDPSDRSAIVLLWVAAASGFFTLRLLAYTTIEGLGVAVEGTFEGVQSAIINVASIGLMLWGTRARDRDFITTAVLVVIVGGLKVFVYDLRTISGIPLVLAVFSFGVAAAVGSIVLGKWQRPEEKAEAD